LSARPLGNGWLPASLTPRRLASGKARLVKGPEAAGRDPAQLSVATQLVVCRGRTQEEAEKRFKASRVYYGWPSVALSRVVLSRGAASTSPAASAASPHRS